MSAVAAAAAAAAASAAAHAAALAAVNAEKAGAEADEVALVAEKAGSLASVRARIKAQGLPKAETERALHAEWIRFSLPYFQILDDETRLTIIGLLRAKESMTVTQIKEALDLELSSTSAQLGRLRAVKLVRARRDAQNAHYSLNKVFLGWVSSELAEGLK